MEFTKRPGTFGFDGNFFESKFVSLVLLRLQKKGEIKDFFLASNMDGVGAFDDMCLKINIVGRKQPLALYVQLKHKDDKQEHSDENEKKNERLATLNMDKSELIKYINSYLLIKDNITSQKSNSFYENMSVTESVFILYTNAKFKLTGLAINAKELYTPFVSSSDVVVNELLATGITLGRQLQCPEQLVQDVARDLLAADLLALAERFALYLIDRTEHVVDIQNDRYLRQYHVILKKAVLNVSDIQTGNNGSKWRTLTFRHDFFESQVCEHMEVFRRTLIEEILRKHPKIHSRASKNMEHESSIPDSPLTSITLVDELIASFLSEQSSVTLSPLIGTYITCNDEGKLQFLYKRPEHETEQLGRISISQQMKAEALLRSVKLKVPIAFGNVDLFATCTSEKIERWLNNLANAIVDLCKRYEQQKSYKVITIDDTLPSGLLKNSGVLESGVTNILTFDEITKKFMFASVFSPEQKTAQSLYKKLEEKVKLINDGTNNLHEYRFDVRSDKFPKLHLECTDTDHNLLETDLVTLAERFAAFLSNKTELAPDILKDSYMRQYHVILKMVVVHVSDIQKDDNDFKWRTLNFRHDFFEAKFCKHFEIFRSTLLKTILKEHPKAPENVAHEPTTSHASLTSIISVDELVASFLSEQSAVTLSPLIGTYIAHNEDGKLNFLVKRQPQDVERLQQIHISQQTLGEALLLSLPLKVSVDFGNVDLLVKNEKRLNYLVTAIVDLCKQYEPLDSLKVITINDTLSSGLLSHSGGLASGVDNILTFDEKTRLLKFAYNDAPKQENAQSLYKKLIEKVEKNEMNNLHEYRFHIKTDKLPKLRLDCTDTVREFFSKLVVYEKQSNQFKLEEIIKREIQERLKTDTDHCSISSESMFLHYHELMLKWMRQGYQYLKKENNFYEQAKKYVKAEPLISALHNTFYISNRKYFQYSFSEAAIDEMKLPTDLSKVFIVSSTVTLTTMKVIQWLRKHDATNNHVVLDLECVFGLQTNEFSSLETELKETRNVIIMVWHSRLSKVVHNTRRGFCSLANATSNSRVFIITNNEMGESEKSLFSCPNIINRKETESLCAMVSHERIMNDTKVIFQGRELKADLIFDEKSVNFVKGVVLDNIIRNQTISIGASLSNTRYEEIKHYINRRVSRVSNCSSDSQSCNDGSASDSESFCGSVYSTWNESLVGSESFCDSVSCDSEVSCVCESPRDNDVSARLVTSFFDIEDDVVLLTAPPGMGKSTLVTHLSLNTKDLKREMVLWIVRVNFVDYTKQFRVWHVNKTLVSVTEALKFMCQVILGNNKILFDVEIKKTGEAGLVTSSADELLTFKLNLFLHFYNQRRLIFVFDGFDEICPDYKITLIHFLIAAKSCSGIMKIWVTSRPYSDILPELQEVLGRGLQIEYLSYAEQESYLRQYWIEHLQISNVNSRKLDTLLTFIYSNMVQTELKANDWIQFACCVFADAANLYGCPSIANCTRLKTLLECFRDTIALDVLSGIPMILYFIGNYFINVLYMDKHPGKNNLKINLHDIYQMFIENKILSFFQDKNKLDLSNTITRVMCEEQLAASVSTHKQIAAYHLIQEPIISELDNISVNNDFKYMKLLRDDKYEIEINKIRKGENKLGLISYVTDDVVPVFIHRSFMEYLAAEYACDILTDNEFDIDQKIHWYCAIREYCGEAVNEWINLKRKTDTKLKQVFKQIKEPSRIYAMKYRSYFTRDNMSAGQFIRILASSIDNYNNGLFDIQFVGNAEIKHVFIEYLKGYNISRMKPNLHQYFVGPILFKVDKHTVVRDFNLATNSDLIPYFYNIYLQIKPLRHRRSTPLLMRLEHNSTDDALAIINNSSSSNINDTLSQEDSGNGFVYILSNNYIFESTLDTLLESNDGDAGEFNTLLEATNTVRYPLHYTEQHVEQIADSLFSKRVFVFTRVFLALYNSSHKMGAKYDFGLIRKYQCHDILEERVIYADSDLKESQCKRSQVMVFRDTFWDTDETYTKLFRNYFINQLVNNHLGILHLKDLPSDELISSFLSNPSAATLTTLIGAYIVRYEHDELTFNIKRSPEDKDKLRQLNIPLATIEEAMVAVRTATIEYLRSLQMKVDNDCDDIDLNPFTENTIVRLCKQYVQLESHKVVTVDRMLKDMQLMTVLSKLLTNDEETKMLKFRNHFTSEQNNLKTLREDLNKRVDNLHEYRFQVPSNEFSKLHLHYTNIARTFLSKLVIYAEQANYYKMEAVLRNECLLNKQESGFIRSQLAFLHYYSEMVKWWMPRDTAPCHNDTAFYKQALDNIRAEPLIIDLHTKFHVNNLKYVNFSIVKNSTKCMKLLDRPLRTVIVTDVVTLTALEVMQYLREHDSIENYAILDLKYVYNISSDEILRSLCTELRKSKRVVIIVWYNTQVENDFRILHEVAEAVTNGKFVVIGNDESRTIIKKYFACISLNFENETERWLAKDLPKKVLQIGKATTQGEEVSLGLMIDDELVSSVNGCVFDKVFRDESISIGAPLSDSHYDQIRDTYIGRRVSASDNANDVRLVNTFRDIAENLVLLTAPPGMGKSTLLTHLSVSTKQQDNKLVIVRVNFIDHLEQFKKWHNDDTVLNIEEVLQFLCCVVLRKENVLSCTITIINGEIRLQNLAGDEFDTFQLQMFFHFYNQGRVILAFDGFDEICPCYKDAGLTFLTVVASTILKNKMWVTSRPYSDVLPDLQGVLSTGFKLLAVNDKELYIKNVAREELIMNMFNRGHEGLGYLFGFENTAMFLGVLNTENARTREVSDVLKLSQRLRHTEVHKLSGTSLVLYILADYLVNILNIEDNKQTHYDPEQRVDLQVIYQTFVEERLTDMLFPDEDGLGKSGGGESIRTEARQFIELNEKMKVYYKPIRVSMAPGRLSSKTGQK